jgi:hypothetical protein
MKTILSFDVGMKNLAYCLFQVGDDVNNLSDYKVLQWEVINLCNPIVKKCNNGGVSNCGENAKYCKMNKNENENDNENEIEYLGSDYYCNKHAKKCHFKIPPSELDIKKLKKRKLVDIQSIVDKYKISPINHESHEPHAPHVSNVANDHVNILIPKRQKNTKEQLLDMIQRELEKNYLENIENIRADQIE